MTRALRLALVLALGVPVAGGVQAQGRWAAIDDAVTGRVEFRIREATAYCGWLGGDWVADCLADQYDQIARSLPGTPDWAPVRRELTQAAQQVAAVARQSAQPGVRPARPDEAGNPTRVGAGRALQRTLAAARPAAARVVAETQTRLLRSVSGSDARAAAFRRVAAAVGSGITLLRST